jgi:parallel beta helix pectate lyase-like protein
MRTRLLLALLAAAVLVPAAPAYAGARFVSNAKAFQRAVSDFRQVGGRIVLLPGPYRRPLTVGPRSNSLLDIVGTAGARIQSLRIDHSNDVIVRGLVVRPLTGDAGIVAKRSRRIIFRGDTFTAKGTEFKVGLRLNHSRGVVVRSSTFSHCGDHTPKWSTCLLPRWAAHTRIVRNWFHDCRGCDFIGGRAGPDLVIRENRFDRALACHTGWVKCAHQDLIELFNADGMVVTRNIFGVSQGGGGQLNLAAADDNVRIVDNLFLRDDPRAPGIVARVAILAGTRAGERIPRNVSIVNNTILSGAPKGGHAQSSIVLSPHYSTMLSSNRPVIANNVLAWLMVPALVCGLARDSLHNVVAAGTACGVTDVVGDPLLSARGRPTAGSALVIDQADPALAPSRDIDGAARVGPPDIGAYEFS